jgi:hypothetical protein
VRVRYLIPLMQKGDQRVRLNSDVPLYAPCTGASCCQKVAPALAQLQRLYFVTPNQPESILLRPRIQVLTPRAHTRHTHTHDTHTHTQLSRPKSVVARPTDSAAGDCQGRRCGSGG